jgi:hypothetical protein
MTEYPLTSTPSVFHSSRKMHWDRTVARTLLIFSVTNIAFAAHAVVRPTHIGVAEATSEKRLLDDEATDGSDGSDSEPMPELVSDSDSSRYLSASTDSGSNRYLSASESLGDSSSSGSSHDDWPPVSPAPSLHDGTGAYNFFSTPRVYWLYEDEAVLDHTSGPESLDGSSHASHPDPALVSPAGSLHQDFADSAPELPPSDSGLLHQDAIPSLQLQSSGSLHHHAALDLEPSSSLNQGAMPDSQPPASLHQDVEPDLQPPSVPLHQDSIPESQPSDPLHQDSVPGSPLHDTFFNDALKKKLKIYAGVGTIVGVSVGLTIGIQKLIDDTRSHGVYVSPLFPPGPSLFCHKRSDLRSSSVKQLEGILQIVTSSAAV